MDTNKCEVSVVLPCLNEEKTIEECIRRAKKALAEADILGEVVVADNGSTDRSTKIAQVEGARVSIAKTAGYGNALFAGFAEAQGKFIIFLDADLSYEFSHIPRFVEELRNGAELVMGSRFKGTIDHGAMPFLHRYFGTPFLTKVVNILFKCNISDVNCGMRGLTKETFERLGLKSGGMEFASEMIVKASLLKVNIVEIPTDLHRDQRGRRPHLRSFSDGWRHLRLMLLFCPVWLFFVPGLFLIIGGIGGSVVIMLDKVQPLGIGASLIGLICVVLGVQAVLLSIATLGFSQIRRLRVDKSFLGHLFSYLTLEKGIILGSLFCGIGFFVLSYAGLRIYQFMLSDSYLPGQVDILSTKLALLGTIIFAIGTQVVFSSFFLGLFNIEPVSIDDK